MKPILVACPACHIREGKRCLDMRTPEGATRYLKHFHEERVRRAQGTTVETPPEDLPETIEVCGYTLKWNGYGYYGDDEAPKITLATIGWSGEWKNRGFLEDTLENCIAALKDIELRT